MDVSIGTLGADWDLTESEGAMKRFGSIGARPIVILVLAISGSIAIPAARAGSGQEQKAQPKSESKEKEAALTGCVDEQGGQYVLVDDRNLLPIANLEAEGFPKESFAKHLGHKVTVRGTSNSNGARPTFKVRSIETVSNICEPKK
jgi:hypothetical protein